MLNIQINQYFFRFDVFNSRTKYSKKFLECGFGVHLEEQAAVIQKMIRTVHQMCRVGRKSGNIHFQKGIEISSKSLLSLYNDLSTKRNVEFILTSHLNQDCLENFFSRVRALGGSYTHPTTVEFIHRTKNLIIGKSSELVIQTAAVQMEDDSNSTENSGFLSQLLTKSIEPEQP